MRKKLVIGIIMVLAGILLNELSGIVDIWLIRILIRISSTIIWMVGLVMGTRAIDYLHNQKKK